MSRPRRWTQAFERVTRTKGREHARARTHPSFTIGTRAQSNPIDERREVLRLAEGNAADQRKALVALAKYSGSPIAFA